MSYIHFEGVDAATAALIIELQQEDIQKVKDRSKGKGREGELSDVDLALEQYNLELERQQQFLADLRLAESISNAVQADGRAIVDCVAEEIQAQGDRQLAQRSSGKRVKSPKKHNVHIPAAVASDTSEPEASSSSSSASWASWESWEFGSWQSDKSPDAPYVKCEICSEETADSKLVTLLCGHPYCEDCLRQLFESCLTDESLFPPRCCRQRIVIEKVKHLLSPELLSTFADKKLEFESNNRTHCSKSSCSAFLPQSEIENYRATCSCGTVTCSICKSEAHDGHCPEDSTLQELLSVATKEGWQRCFSCKSMIELDTGCYHMTCRCGAEFCYHCGKKWKTCRCHEWDENRLIARANQP